MASAFLKNDEGFSDVHHKNDNKKDNRVENLQWLSHKDNLNSGDRNKKISL